MNRSCISIVIEVPNALMACEDYQFLFNCGANKFNDDVYQFALNGIDLWLKQTTVDSAKITKINLAGTTNDQSTIDGFQICPPSHSESQTDVGIDMVVYMANNLQQVRDVLSANPLNLTAHKTITLGENNSELSFYPLDSLLLEVGEYQIKGEQEDGFWGLGLAVKDINEYHRYLRSCNIDVSDVRVGMKPNTLVATIKSHHLGIPTLLVGPDK